MPVALLNEIILMAVGGIIGYKTGKFVQKNKEILKKANSKSKEGE